MCSDLLIDKCDLEDDFRESCSKHFEIFGEKYSSQSLLLRKLQYV